MERRTWRASRKRFGRKAGHTQHLGLVLWAFLFQIHNSAAHPSHPLEAIDYPIVSGFENFFIQEDSDDYLAQGGELLLSELNCVGCHHPSSDAVRDRIPGKPGPVLSAVGLRLRPDDIRLFVRNPRFVKRGTTMPTLFAGRDRDPEEIEALTHFLASQREEPRTPRVFPQGDAERGKALYHRVGCVACHSMELGYRPPNLPDGIELEPPVFPSIPLALTYIYDEARLAAFLMDPLADRPGGRMPDLKLSAQEAADIAAYLKTGLPEQPRLESEPFQMDPMLVERGREVFVRRNCVSCHEMSAVAGGDQGPSAKPLEELNPQAERSCLSETPSDGGLPYFYLDFIQQQAIALALERLKTPEGAQPLDAEQRVDRIMTIQNCYACHSREGKGGAELSRTAFFEINDLTAASLGDFGNIPPDLTHAGRKLTREWMEKTLYGSGGEVRPFMAVRMPHFGKENIGPLVEAFALADGHDPRVEINTSGLQKNHPGDSGRELMGVNGLGCITCHGVREARALGAPSINLTHTVSRLQPGYFKELLKDPQAIQSGMPMPPVFRDRQDADRDIEEIWTYLREIDQMRLPDGPSK